jgi:hypothetical protein
LLYAGLPRIWRWGQPGELASGPFSSRAPAKK